MRHIIENVCEKENLILTDKILENLNSYYELLIETNEKFNLTSITDKKEVYIKHFADSLLGIRFFPENSTVIDIGAGAGFPSMVLKIFRPDLKITMLDSLNKRVCFLKETAEKLKLSDCSFVHGRAEDFAKDKNYREKFDIACARAVAKMNTLAEYSLPFVKIGGSFVAYKANAEEEINECKSALKILGGKICKVHESNLPITEDFRTIVVVNKITQTPGEYPRSQQKPRRNPL